MNPIFSYHEQIGAKSKIGKEEFNDWHFRTNKHGITYLRKPFPVLDEIPSGEIIRSELEE